MALSVFGRASQAVRNERRSLTLFKELMAFCAVAKFNSFSKASEHLGIVQPTVTTQVQRLERQLGNELFDRRKRPIQLTNAGAKLFRLALPYFDDLEGLFRRITESEPSGVVRMASSVAMTDHVLPDAVRIFLGEYPGRQVQGQVDTTDGVVRLVEAREVDLGIVPEHMVASSLDFEPLFEYRWLLIAPLGHPILNFMRPTLAEISRCQLVVRRRRSVLNAWSMLETMLRDKELDYRVVLELDQTDSIKRYVSAGVGISLMPEFAVESMDLSSIGVRDMTHMFPLETAGILTVKLMGTQPIVSDFINCLRSAVALRKSRSSIPSWQPTAQ